MIPSPTAATTANSAPPLGWIEWLARVFGWGLLAFIFITPPTQVMDWGLDSSNYGTYAWMFATGKNFGTDVVPMTGPYGFLFYGTTYAGWLFTARLVGDVLLKCFLAFIIVRFVVLSRTWAGWLCLAVIVICAPNIPELPYDLGILFAGCNLLLSPGPRPRPGDWIAAVLLGFLALLKGTQLTLVLATLGAVGLRAVLEKKPAWFLVPLAACAASFLGFWIAAGQEPLHLAGYVRGIRALVQGYNDTMGLDEDAFTRLSGFTIVAGLGGSLLLSGLWRDRARLPLFLFLAGFLFVKWKHGFVRADGHVYIFFYFCAVLLAAVWALRPPFFSGEPAAAPLPARARRTGYAALGVPLLCFTLFAACEFWDQRFYAIFRDILPHQAVQNFRYLTSPAAVRVSLERDLAQNRIAADLPQVRNEIGDATIDFFGYEQGVLLLNGFNYHPRPMGGGTFNVYHPYLQQLNDAFIRDPARRPAFQLMRLATIDDRLPAGDDPLTLNALLSLYTPVLIQRDYLLFRDNPGAAAPHPVKLAEIAVKPGEIVPVPVPPPGQMLLFALRAPPSVFGWLRAAVYRPSPLEAEVVTDRFNRHYRYRLPPTILKAPVILSPLLHDNLDVIRLYGRDPGERVRTLRLLPQDERMFDPDHLRVIFYTLPRPPPPVDTDVQEIITYMKFPLHNRAPLGLRTEETGIRELNKEPVTLVHAPGEITYPLERDDQQVIFSYGLMPQTYDPGQTDGVEFFVEVLPPGGPVMTLFRRYLQPVTDPAHRGMQRARVYLPPGLPAGSVLRLRTGSGPAANGAWDQSYITRLQIKAGGADPRRYFGFNVAPLAPGFAADAAFLLDGRPVTGVHPPTELHFPLPAGARRVVAGFGLMPGAYTGENRTDGVEFAFAVRRPDGSLSPLARRRLDPLQQAADRGIVTLELALPDFAEGSQLVFTTGPGPTGNLSWDWAVLQTLHIE